MLNSIGPVDLCEAFHFCFSSSAVDQQQARDIVAQVCIDNHPVTVAQGVKLVCLGADLEQLIFEKVNEQLVVTFADQSIQRVDVDFGELSLQSQGPEELAVPAFVCNMRIISFFLSLLAWLAEEINLTELHVVKQFLGTPGLLRVQAVQFDHPLPVEGSH
jgi:type III secretory pathway component EscT